MSTQSLDPEGEQRAFSQFIGLLKDEEYVSLAKVTGVRIPGFRKGNYSNVPISLLKKQTQWDLLNLKRPARLMKAFVAKHKEAFSDLDLPAFIMKVQSEGSLTQAEIFALFVDIFPDLYDKHKKTIAENIENSRHFWHGLIDLDQQTFADRLNTFFTIHRDAIADEVKARHFLLPDESTWDAFMGDRESDGIKTSLEADALPGLAKGIYLQLFLRESGELGEWDLAEKHAFYKLVLLDTMQTALNVSRQLAEDVLQTEETLDQLEETSVQLNESLQKKDDHIADLTQKLKKADSNVEELGKMKRSDEQDMHQLTVEINQLRDEMQQLKNENRMLHKRQATMRQASVLVTDPSIFLLTKDPIDRLQLFLPEKQVLPFTELHEAVTILNELAQQEEVVLFVNTEGLNTKDIFTIESALKKRHYIFKLVSGDAKKVVRQVIYHLEGDIRHEIREPY